MIRLRKPVLVACATCCGSLDLRRPHVADVLNVEQLGFFGAIKVHSSEVADRRHLACAEAEDDTGELKDLEAENDELLGVVRQVLGERHLLRSIDTDELPYDNEDRIKFFHEFAERLNTSRADPARPGRDDGRR